jgi:hypothetical protein
MTSLLLVCLLFAPPEEDLQQRILALEGRARETAAGCDRLDRTLEAQGREIKALSVAGEKEQARALMQKNHGMTEELTSCRLRQKALDKEIGDARERLAAWIGLRLDEVLRSAEPVNVRYPLLVNLLQLLNQYVPSASCPVERYEGVDLSPEDGPEALAEKRLIIQSVLEKIRKGRAVCEDNLNGILREIQVLSTLNTFMKEMQVVGSTRMSDLGRADRDFADQRAALEEKSLQIRRDLKILETMQTWWEQRRAEAGRLQP